jgi:hypothetical protein
LIIKLRHCIDVHFSYAHYINEISKNLLPSYNVEHYKHCPENTHSKRRYQKTNKMSKKKEATMSTFGEVSITSPSSSEPLAKVARLLREA